MFKDIKAFNQDISGWLKVGSRLNRWNRCLAVAEAFNQDISDWDADISHKHESSV